MFSSVVKETNLNGILFNVAKNETQSLQMHILSYTVTACHVHIKNEFKCYAQVKLFVTIEIT